MYFSQKKYDLQIHHHSSLESEGTHWQSFKNGNAISFEYLYKTYSPGLYNYGAKFTKDKDLIKECIQDLFVSLWIKRSSIGNPEHIRNYLYKSFRHSIFKRAFQLQKNEIYEETENYSFNVVLNIEETIIDRENQTKVSEQLGIAMNKLTSRQKEAIFLRFYEHLSYEEIAEIMGISVKASYKLMARSLNYLRENLSKDDLLLLYLAFHLKLFA